MKPQTTRNFKKNLFYSKLCLLGLNLTALGAQLNPPVKKHRVWQIAHFTEPEDRLKEIAAILGTNVQTIWPKKNEAA
jgi:hypothetical protein